MKLYTISNGEIIYKIPPDDNGKPLRDILRKLKLSHGAISIFKRNSAILIDGENRFANKPVFANETLSIQINSCEAVKIDAEDIDLDIIFEDEFILAVNKPAGMPSHPARRYISGTLANAAAGYLARTSPSSGVHLVNRLDKNTSGIVIIAKNSFSKHMMCERLENMQKIYIAVSEGEIAIKEALINAPIARRETSIIERCVQEDGQSASTQYSVQGYSNDTTIVMVRPKTGRTHQIRVHFAYIGHPLCGDTLYGGHDDKIQRHALHAWKFIFCHPIDNIEITLQADLPEDMQLLIPSERNVSFEDAFTDF